MQRLYKLVIATLLLSGAIINADNILFIKENIAVTIIPPDTIQIEGEYFFTAAGPESAVSQLYYPFVVDSTASYPCFISVNGINAPGVIPFFKQEQGAFFEVKTTTRDTTGVVVIYRQQVKNKHGTYILTTTNNWGRPLINSNYSITVPQTLTLNYLSYECDTVTTTEKSSVYKFFRKQFMPDRDLSFTWTKR